MISDFLTMLYGDKVSFDTCGAQDGDTPLLIAASQGLSDIVEFLCKQGGMEIVMHSNKASATIHTNSEYAYLCTLFVCKQFGVFDTVCT
jgi:hypothetical protein